MDVREDGGLRPGYELKLNSYDLGVDVELYDAVQRLRFEHPEVGAVVLRSAKERVFCAGANIRMLGQSCHALEGELLQVHERDAQRDRGGRGRVAPDLALRGQRAVRGRRLRAGAGLRAHRDGRRRQHVGGPARGARCSPCCPARVASRASSTSATCAAIAPTCSARSRRASRAGARSSGGSWTRWCRARSSRRRCASAPRSWRRGATARARRRGIALTPLERTIEGDRIPYAHVDVR